MNENTPFRKATPFSFFATKHRSPKRSRHIRMDRQTALGWVVVLSCAQFAPILYAAGVQRVHDAKASPATVLTSRSARSVTQSKSDIADKLVFEGKVVRIGKPPPVLCGVVAPFRLAEYHIEQINQGRYDKRKIIVDHLFCSWDVLSDLKPGEKVIVEVVARKKILERSNDGELRRDTDIVDTFYLAKKVTPVSSVATSERRRNYHHRARDPLFLIDTTGVSALPRAAILKDKCEFSSYKPSTVSHFVQTSLKTKVTPKYPIEAVQRGIEGRISVKILVDRDGNVSKACALNGDEVLRQAAEEAALQWKFKRNVVQGWQSYVQAGISFNFVLDRSRSKDADAIRP